MSISLSTYTYLKSISIELSSLSSLEFNSSDPRMCSTQKRSRDNLYFRTAFLTLEQQCKFILVRKHARVLYHINVCSSQFALFSLIEQCISYVDELNVLCFLFTNFTTVICFLKISKIYLYALYF